MHRLLFYLMKFSTSDQRSSHDQWPQIFVNLNLGHSCYTKSGGQNLEGRAIFFFSNSVLSNCHRFVAFAPSAWGSVTKLFAALSLFLFVEVCLFKGEFARWEASLSHHVDSEPSTNSNEPDQKTIRCQNYFWPRTHICWKQASWAVLDIKAWTLWHILAIFGTFGHIFGPAKYGQVGCP